MIGKLDATCNELRFYYVCTTENEKDGDPYVTADMILNQEKTRNSLTPGYSWCNGFSSVLFVLFLSVKNFRFRPLSHSTKGQTMYYTGRAHNQQVDKFMPTVATPAF